MRVTNEEQPALEPIPVAGSAWGLMAPGENSSLIDIRVALHEAQSVIRTQEERIRKLESLALTDELTGLVNRRGLFSVFKHELALTRRDADYQGILILVDIDGFKGINDTYGHQKGDAYLSAVAQALQESVRASDTVARYGGDEFAIIMTHMNERTGAKRVARMEKSFSRRFVLPENLPLRASFGFAPYSGLCDAPSVIRAADVRLYECKERRKKN